MKRALAKAGLQAAFGHAPGGPALYRRLTRVIRGTQAGHVTKLSRVWPGYVEVWASLAGLRLEGARLWIHEGGWTPFPQLVGWLTTGAGVTVTNGSARVQARYLARAVDGALGTCPAAPASRQARVRGLKWAPLPEALAAVDARLHQGVDPRTIPLADDSVDLCHSGGALEHLDPATLRAFLEECHRALRPGGIASHVFDHRDHLHHADPRWPFHAHHAWPEPLYRLAFGHALGFHNRLPPAEVVALFEAVGFERIAVRRCVLGQHYVPDDMVEAAPEGLRPRLRARRWRMDPRDARTTAAHYLFRKPV